MLPLFWYVIMICDTLAFDHAYMDGDVIIAGLFGIKHSHDSHNGQCSDINPSSVKSLEAVKWTLRNLNEKNYIPGITLGLEAWSTCGLTEISNDRTIELINRINSEKVDQTYLKPPVIGLIGPEHSSEAATSSNLLSSLRATDRLVQIGYSTTAASLSNRELYPNFYRVIPNDQLQIEVMISLLKQLEWNYIVVLYDGDVYGIEAYTFLQKRATEEDICIQSSFAITSHANGVVSRSQMESFLDKTLEMSVSGVVVFSTTPRINVLLNAAEILSETNSDQISFLFSEGIELSEKSITDSTGNVYPGAKGSYIVTPPSIIITEFENYWKNIFRNVSRIVEESYTNVWLGDLYAFYDEDNCFVSNDTLDPGCSDLDQTERDKLNETFLYTSYAIEATLFLAKLLKGIHSKHCSSQSGLCDGMKSILYTKKGFLVDEVRKLKVDFRSDFPIKLQGLENLTSEMLEYSNILNGSEYEVRHFRKCYDQPDAFCFEKIGHYQDWSLNLDTTLIRDYHGNDDGDVWPNVNRAQCLVGKVCSSCIIGHISEEIFYEPGDVIIGGIIPIHNKDNDVPFKCDGIRTSLGVQIAEAIAFGISVVNEKKGMYKDYFPGQKIGFAFIDSCNQRLVVARKLYALLHKGVIRPDGKYEPITDRLIGWIGAYGSGISMETSRILSQIGLVQIAYASTAAALSDRTEYPNFMRTCTPDNKQARAMISIIKELNSNFIQVVYSEGTYGEGGRDAIREEARLQSICIKNEIIVKEGDNYLSIVNTLRKNSFAKIVILFVRSHLVTDITYAINGQMMEGEFMFIGSEAWGYRPDEFQDKRKFIGSITLSLQMAENDNFTSYLSNLDILSNTRDPWLKTYAEKKFNCFFDTSFDKSSGTVCNRNLRLTDLSSFKQDIWTPFALNAVLVLLSGANGAFKEICGTSSTTLCKEYQQNYQTVRNWTLHQTFDIFGNGDPKRIFDDNGDGSVGYKIFNIKHSKENVNILQYSQVGQSPLEEANFKFDTESFIKPDGLELPSTCPNEKECNACFPKSTTGPTGPPQQIDGDNTVTVVLGVFVGILSLVVLILIGIVIHNKCHRKPLDELYLDAVENPYAKPFQNLSFRDNQSFNNTSNDSGVDGVLNQCEPPGTEVNLEISENIVDAETNAL